MADEKPTQPSERELATLQVLWEKVPATVKEINEVFNRQKSACYTTTLKLMQIMYEKGLLIRTSEGAKGRLHLYSPAVKETQISTHLLDNFIQRVFQGSTAKLAMRALGQAKTSPEEIEQIKKFLDDIDKNRPL